ncbi:UPF0481 protein At3g47200-like [Phalaenopsis equestris]|uniref:UPF0481 protein At3g47200-like n=1 Tax=Phalaenopsis equestris TaxID=78828 RepID=UPI0009E29D9E|nr:UPF0481 protein At3g47200-like [Phalaenopsis equestris]
MATGTSVDRSWITAIQKEANNPSKDLDLWRKHSIYLVPSCIKDLNPKAYRPQIVSFGPYHHADPELASMEEHKHRALLHLLRRAKKPLEDFVAGIEEIVGRLQSSYQGLEERWKGGGGDEEFLRLMVVDGCFMLEILRLNVGQFGDYAADDPIFSNHGMLHTLPYIKRDMLIVENQLPLLALEKLVSVEAGKPANPDQINRLVLKLCSPESPAPTPGIGLGLHPLDLHRRSLLQSPSTPSDLPPRFRSSDSSSPGIIRSAIELYEAGIRFRKSRTTSLLDIRFHHGVLSLPAIVVDDATQYAYLNLMAFERLHVGAGSEITSYVFFMDNIIDSAKDVSLLHSKGIIQNALGSDKAVANLFNSISKDVTLDPDSSLEAVQKRVNAYCQKRWNMWRANLIHTYFRSPWAFLSLAAAIFLLVLSVLQTVYSVLPYYQTGEAAAVMAPPPPPPMPQAPPPGFSPRRGV